ncbi:Naringenin-2-oxoglutarate 3-dioxygenase [Nymphaea thermarum]|nr:Naringenin-2-oxoglutarate 3-dioxygenase [Nymphaea thermarum]
MGLACKLLAILSEAMGPEGACLDKDQKVVVNYYWPCLQPDLALGLKRTCLHPPITRPSTRFGFAAWTATTTSLSTDIYNSRIRLYHPGNMSFSCLQESCNHWL